MLIATVLSLRSIVASGIFVHYKKCMNGAKILMLGVAYKADIDDLRESPALDIIAMLKAHGAKVTYHDSYVPKVWVGKDAKGEDSFVHSRELTKEVLEESDLVVHYAQGAPSAVQIRSESLKELAA